VGTARTLPLPYGPGSEIYDRGSEGITGPRAVTAAVRFTHNSVEFVANDGLKLPNRAFHHQAEGLPPAATRCATQCGPRSGLDHGNEWRGTRSQWIVNRRVNLSVRRLTMAERPTSFSQQEILAPLQAYERRAYLCRKKRFLAVSYTNCPQI